MTIRYLTILVALILLIACKKNNDLPPKNSKHESYVFSGTIRNCITDKPVKGIRIQVEAYWDSMLFGTREDVGQVITDEQGKFAIRPKKIDDHFEDYIITYYYPNGFGETEYITVDSIHRSGLENYIFDFKVVELGCVKINLNNVQPFDTADVVYINYIQNPIACTYNPPVIASQPNPIKNFGFKGIIHNGFVYRSIWADDSVKIGWRVLRNGDTSLEQFLSAYVRVNDTTILDLNY